jgi:hypothetical protein
MGPGAVRTSVILTSKMLFLRSRHSYHVLGHFGHKVSAPNAERRTPNAKRLFPSRITNRLCGLVCSCGFLRRFKGFYSQS